jgi:hypothetical protein
MATYETVEEPIPFPQAFHETGDAACQSQAAVLLTLGALMRYEARDAREAIGFAMAPASELLDFLPEEEREALNLPPEIFRLRAARGSRFDSHFLRDRLSAYDRSFIWFKHSATHEPQT